MVKYILAVILLGIQLAVFAEPFRLNLPLLTERFMDCFTQKVDEEKDLIATAKVADIDPCTNKINKFRLEFDMFAHPSMPEARLLIMSVLDGFLNAINADRKLYPHLAKFPFTPNEVDIRIEFRSTECDKFYPFPGNIAYVMAYDGRIVYNTLNSYNYFIERYSVESYDEARRNLSR